MLQRYVYSNQMCNGRDRKETKVVFLSLEQISELLYHFGFFFFQAYIHSLNLNIERCIVYTRVHCGISIVLGVDAVTLEHL